MNIHKQVLFGKSGHLVVTCDGDGEVRYRGTLLSGGDIYYQIDQVVVARPDILPMTVFYDTVCQCCEWVNR